MHPQFALCSRITRAGRLCADDDAVQILEFALTLPLLVVFVVGIFDFSGALSLKQKLTNAAREGARVAAADPANDLSDTSGTPASVIDALQVVDKYLFSENIYDCGLTSALPARSGSTLTWVSTATTGCGSTPPNGIKLTINRGFVTKLQNTSTEVVSTQVTIQYAYKWRFSSVISLLVPRSTYASTSYITTSATVFNEN
ncbi:MAG: pilus assembly protein [Candidatus Sulfotelmatobacter sp.]|nr:pilus assembly protein [Candidatus Sulfotelmatobacter sp.]